MADNKVTIDVAWFDELRNASNGEIYKTLEAELKAANETNSAQADQLRDALNALEQECMNKCDEVTVKRLAAAERCIDNLERACKNCKENINGGNYGQAKLNMDYCAETIRFYREKKEAK